MVTNRSLAFAGTLALLTCCCVQARLGWATTPAPLFDDTGLLEIEMTGPISSTIEDRDRREERAFALAVDGVEQDVWVKVRGRSRSRKDVCKFPLLRLRFEGAMGVFAGQDKLKLVTHCRNSDRGDADVMEEYAAYRSFNLLSPVSYRVRPVRITYSDSDGRLTERAQRRFGFFIEPSAQMANRTGGSLPELEGLSLAQLDPDHSALVYVFQYMIGNTDWSMVTGDGETYCCHNGQLLEVGGWINYVPYDFDLAGVVNAPYAKPDPSLRLRSVRTRRYRGFCTQPETLRAALRTVIRNEENIYRIFRTAPGIGDKQKRADIEYLGRFFEEARNEEELLAYFEKRCLLSGK
jgi:hypothetical protein